jgi:glucose/arabinose dehydrogenase
MVFRADAFARQHFRRPLLNLTLFFFLLLATTLGLWRWVYPPNSIAAAPRVVWPTISLHLITSGLSSPTSIGHAGDGSGRLLITERVGRIRIFNGSSLLATPFLDISSRVQSSGSEQGLLSVAFPPNYVSKGYFYVDYTSNIYGAIGDTIVARYHVTANPDVADPNSEQIIVRIPQPEANHNGGQLQFGPDDGFLYIGMGDGGGGGDSHGTIGNAQDPSQLLGKLLRINVEPGYNPYPTPALTFTPAFTLFLPYVTGVVSPPVTYTIPITNPYTSTIPFRPEIWAWGLRNPWRFSFDRQNGDLYIGDVGQNSYEEVDFQPSTIITGPNYGWRCYEGNHPYDFSNNANCNTASNFVFPVIEYPHSPECSVTGGYIYRGSSYAALQGIYFYADYCSAKVWGLRQDGSTWVSSLLATLSSSISSFGEDQAGELYVAGYGNGAIYQIQSP